jgi:hypothetical protein
MGHETRTLLERVVGCARVETTASTPRLIDAVRLRAEAGPCEFALLIPDASDRKAADLTLDTALRLLRPAARRPVEGLVSSGDPFESVKQAVSEGDFDEIIVSTLPRRTSRLRRDLIRRVENLGLPMTAVVPKGRRMSAEDQLLLAGAAGANVGDVGLGGSRTPDARP